MAAGDLVTVVKFFLLSGESQVSFGKQVSTTCSADEIHELAELIRAAEANG